MQIPQNSQQPQQSQQYTRRVPINELDLNMQLTDPVLGTANIPGPLQAKLKKYYKVKIDKKETVTIEDLWSNMAFYTRDFRLGNLSMINGEFQYCQYHIDLANDFLQSEMITPFCIALARVHTVLELSQSKGGFFRRLINTFIHKEQKMTIEPPRRRLFGGGKNEPND